MPARRRPALATRDTCDLYSGQGWGPDSPPFGAQFIGGGRGGGGDSGGGGGLSASLGGLSILRRRPSPNPGDGGRWGPDLGGAAPTRPPELCQTGRVRSVSAGVVPWVRRVGAAEVEDGPGRARGHPPHGRSPRAHSGGDDRGGRGEAHRGAVHVTAENCAISGGDYSPTFTLEASDRLFFSAGLFSILESSQCAADLTVPH